MNFLLFTLALCATVSYFEAITSAEFEVQNILRKLTSTEGDNNNIQGIHDQTITFKAPYLDEDVDKSQYIAFKICVTQQPIQQQPEKCMLVSISLATQA